MGKSAAIALALALLPCPAQAQPIAAAFAPPLDREIRYEIVETRHSGGMKLAFTLDQRVRFARAGDGYRMTVIMHAATTDAPADIARRFDAAFHPFIGLAIMVQLSPQGKPLGLIDEAATWNKLVASIEALKADRTLAPDVAATIEQILTGIAALPPDARRAKLMEGPLKLVGYALPPMEPGSSRANGDAREGASATLRTVDSAALGYAITTRRSIANKAMITGKGELVVDRATGLLARSQTQEWVRAPGQAADGDPDAIVTVRRLP